MKIKNMLVVGHDASRTGAPMSLLNFLKWVKNNTDIQLEIILGRGGNLLAEYESLGKVYVWHRVNNSSLWRRVFTRLTKNLFKTEADNKWKKEIVQSIRKKKIEIIFNNTVVNGDILTTLSQEISAPLVSRIPELEATIRYFNHFNHSPELTFKASDKIIAVSKAVKENLCINHGIASEKIEVVYGTPKLTAPIQDTNVRKELGLPEDAFVVGGCGTLDWRKGIDLFIQVADQVVNFHGLRNVYFIWLGASIYPRTVFELEYDIEKLKLKNVVLLVGQQENPFAYYQIMDLFLLTSREDPFPLVMIEAGMSGVPVVCFQGSGGAEEFVDESTGGVVPYLNIDQMAQAVCDYKQNEHKLKQAAQQITQKAETYKVDGSSKQILNILHSTLA